MQFRFSPLPCTTVKQQLCDRLLLLFVYFQVNNGVVYLVCEDSASSWSSALVAMIVLDLSLLFDDVTHNNCFVFAVFLVSLHGDILVAPVAQRYHVTSDTLGREFDPGKRDFSH